MESVAVGGFDDHEIGFGSGLGVPDQGAVHVAKVTGEQQRLALHGDVDAGGAHEMARVLKANLHAVENIVGRTILAGVEQLQSSLRVGNGIDRLHRRLTGTLGLAVAPLGLRLLTVSRVHEQNAAELGGGFGGVDLSVEALLDQSGDHAGVVNVGVGQQNGVDLSGRQRKVGIFKQIRTLFHAVIDHDVVPACLQQGSGPGDLMARA